MKPCRADAGPRQWPEDVSRPQAPSARPRAGPRRHMHDVVARRGRNGVTGTRSTRRSGPQGTRRHVHPLRAGYQPSKLRAFSIRSSPPLRSTRARSNRQAVAPSVSSARKRAAAAPIRAPLPRRDGSGVETPPGLDLDEHDLARELDHEVELALRAAPARRQHPAAGGGVAASGGVFRGVAGVVGEGARHAPQASRPGAFVKCSCQDVVNAAPPRRAPSPARAHRLRAAAGPVAPRPPPPRP